MIKFIFNLLLLGAAAGIFFMPNYGIKAKYQDIKVINTEIEEYDKANDSAKKLAEKRDELTNTFNSFNDTQKSRLVTFLPDNIDPIRFILEMEGVGKKLGMPVKNARYSQTKIVADTDQKISDTESKFGLFTFEFTTEGSYDNFVKLLGQLENSLRLIDVVSVSITPPSSSAASAGGVVPADFFSYQVKLNAYWLK
jgi:dsDNA-binding SOS-regulon protein